MELKPGYKQTEVGVIPEDWEVTTLGAMADIRKEKFSNRNASIAICVELEHIAQGSGHLLGFSEVTTVNSIKSVFKEDDVLFGKLRSYLRKYWLADKSGICSTEIWPIVARKNVTLGKYLFQIVQTDKFIEASSQAYGTHMPRSDWNIVKNHQIPLPPLPEQRAIAAALSDVDALIQSQDALIAKKRDIKQAAMQQLLTGKQRLPGFSGEWEVKRLGDLALFLKGKGLPKSEINSHGTELCIHYGELFTKYPETITQVQSRTSSTTGVLRSVANDVLMPTSDVTPNGLAKASCIQQSDVILGGDILVIRALSDLLNGSFLSYVIRWQREQIMQLVSGSTVYHLYGSDMKNFSFLLPEVKEQTAIAKVLADMDAEIAALEAQRAKMGVLKQGMMQELLTGKTRLV
jgi:type I restriction enzyme S subunit